jgi:diketogulonate reductase-like aldo/keto reductase
MTSTSTTTIQLQRRKIPSSGELLPVIGVGTWQTFDVGAGEAERAPLKETLRVLFDAGGSVIDSSPMYGRSEQVAGDLLADMQAHDRAFVATKVWTRGREDGMQQMRRSMELLKDERIELMQIHNLVDWRTHLRTLRAWKAEGRIKYLGVTHYTSSAYDELEAVMRGEPLDFVQLNSATRRRSRHRGSRQPAFRRRRFAAGPERRASAAMGKRDRLRQLAAGPAEIRPGPSRGNVRHSRHQQAESHGG